MNKDVLDDQLVNEVKSSPEEEVEKGATDEDGNAGDVVGGLGQQGDIGHLLFMMLN